MPNDDPRNELYALFSQAYAHFESAPDQALALLERGRDLARQLGDMHEALHYEHWRLQVLLFYKRDYGAALESAVRAAVEARAPAYTNLTERICLHEDLIYAYVGVDPVGYAAAIQRALDYMEAEITPGLQCSECLQELKAEFQLELGDLDRALEEGLRHLAIGRNNRFRQMVAYKQLCDIAFQRADWEALAGWARAGEQAAHDEHRYLIEFLAWQALIARRAGDEAAARRYHRRATSLAGRIGATPSRTYFDALCAYHEAAGDLERALRIRERQVATLQERGQTTGACRCLLARARLLARTGQPHAAEVAAARELAQRLANPAPLLAQIAELEA
jgi:hypothetical protein